MSNLLGGIIKSAAENAVRQAVEDKIDDVIDQKAKQEDTTGKIAKGAQEARGFWYFIKRIFSW